MENMEKVVYLDNAATTPCAPEALEMMVKALSGACGNPSSHYSIGYEAKEFVDTGLSVALAAIGLYLLRNLRTCIRDIRRFKQLTRTAKVRLVTFTALLYILIHALVTGTIPYFLLLMMLGIDYLIYDNQPPK